MDRKEYTSCVASGLRGNRKSNFEWSDLEYLYLEKQLCAQEISEIKGCSQSNVTYMIRKLRITTRSHKEAQLLSYRRGRNYSNFQADPRYKDGRRTRSDGYILLKMHTHPRAGKDGYVLEHIVVWEATHNHKLPEGWHIHHINGIKGDNRPNNLVAISPQRHKLKHQTLAEIRKQRIRELEIENSQLRKALENRQALFLINDVEDN